MSVFIFNIINGNGEEMYSKAFCNNTLNVDGEDEIGLLHADPISTLDFAGVFFLVKYSAITCKSPFVFGEIIFILTHA